MLCWSWLSSGFEVSKRPRDRHVGVDDDPGQRVERRLAWPAGDRDVAEALEGEVRLVRLDPAALQHVRDLLLRRAEVVGVEVASLVEHLGVAENDPRPRRPAHLQTDAADHVLAHVEDGLAGRGAEDLHRLDLLDRTYRRAGGRDEGVLRRLGHDPHRRPVGVGEAGRAPAGLLEPRVVGLAHVEVGGEDRAGGGPPLVVGPDRLDAPVGVLDAELAQEPQRFTEHVPAVAPGEVAAVPAVAQRGADRVVARAQERRHVVRLVLEPLAVARPARGEALVADAAAVDLELVEPVARHVGPRGAELPAHREGPAQHRRGLRLLHVLVQRGLDPARLPVAGGEEARLEPRRGAPRGRAARAVPRAHAPEVAVRGLEGGAGVRHVSRLRRADTAAVPESAAGGQRRRVLRDLHLVGRLHGPSRFRAELPAEPRRRRVDAERVLLVLAAQLGDGGRGHLGGRVGECAACRGHDRGQGEGKEGSRTKSRVHEHLPCGMRSNQRRAAV